MGCDSPPPLCLPGGATCQVPGFGGTKPNQTKPSLFDFFLYHLILLPRDESFVPNRSKIFGRFFFVWARFGLRPFCFHQRNFQICGLVWTRVDSCGLDAASGPHPKITILRQDDAPKILSPNPSPHPSPHQFTVDFSPK